SWAASGRAGAERNRARAMAGVRMTVLGAGVSRILRPGARARFPRVGHPSGGDPSGNPGRRPPHRPLPARDGGSAGSLRVRRPQRGQAPGVRPHLAEAGRSPQAQGAAAGRPRGPGGEPRGQGLPARPRRHEVLHRAPLRRVPGRAAAPAGRDRAGASRHHHRGLALPGPGGAGTEGARTVPPDPEFTMTMTPAVWRPRAVGLAVLNVVATGSAADAAEPVHAATDAAFAFLFGYWASHLKRRVPAAGRDAGLEALGGE